MRGHIRTQFSIRTGLWLQLLSALCLLTGATPALATFSSETLNPTESRSEISADLLALMPAAIDCGSTRLVLARSSKGSGTSAEIKLTTDSKTRTRILIDLTDGDQIDTFSFSRTDLVELGRAELTKVDATETAGFWGNDGGHLSATDISCELAKK